jgi:hypothetical protein
MDGIYMDNLTARRSNLVMAYRWLMVSAPIVVIIGLVYRGVI